MNTLLTNSHQNTLTSSVNAGVLLTVMFLSSKSISCRHILTVYDISAGMSIKSDPSYPVSWTTYSDLGHLIALYTLPQYQRKGFPLVLAANIYDQLLQEGIVPFGEQFKESPIAEKYGEYVHDS